MSMLTLRIDDKLDQQLNELAAITGKSKSDIARDALKSHESFKARLGLPFELISDIEGVLCRMFDVVKNKMLYGKKVLGIERSTFLIDAGGILRKEWRSTKADGNAATVLEAVRRL